MFGFLTPQEIYEQLTGGPGSTRLDDAREKTRSEWGQQEDRAHQITRLGEKIRIGWQGQASDAAFGAALPLAQVALQGADQLDTAQDLLSRQSGSFHRAANEVRPMPPQPPDNPLADMIPFETDLDREVKAYQADAQHNMQVFEGYDNASSYNETNMPKEYSTINHAGGTISVKPSGGDTGGDSGGDSGGDGSRPRTSEPGNFGGPGSGGPGSSGGPGGVGGPGGAPVGGPVPGGSPGSGPQQTSPSDVRPGAPGGGFPPAGFPQSPAAQQGGSGGAFPGGGFAPGAGGFGPGSGGSGSGGGFGGRGGGFGGGAGAGSAGGPGAGGAGGSGSRGVGPGAGAGALAAEEAAARRGGIGGAAGARGGAGMSPMGAMGGGRGQGDDDSEHDRKYLVEEDAESVFGSDALTAPQVIGDDEYED
jgi:hypothetical protein